MVTNIAIFYGGPGSEHEVSIASAENFIASVEVSKYSVQKIFIQKDMVCLLDGKQMNLQEVIDLLPKDTIVIPLLHGPYGEGGVLQKILEANHKEYLWSDSKASSLAMDKYETGMMLRKVDLHTPETILVNQSNCNVPFSFPVIVKPRDDGSSVDLFKVEDDVSLEKALIESLTRHKEMLIQECVLGREFTCGVIEKKGELIPLVPTEIILTKGELFDYEAKYTVGGCNEVTPAEISKEVKKRIQEVAVVSHKALGCKDISRTDMIMRENGEIIVLEVNTIPGMTTTSFIPVQVKASGYTLSEIIDIVIDNHI